MGSGRGSGNATSISADSLIDRLRIAEWDAVTNHNLGWHMIVEQDVALKVIDDNVL